MQQESRENSDAIERPHWLGPIRAPHVPSIPRPKASLLGLPAELRLMIYDYLWEKASIHIHHRTSSGALVPARCMDSQTTNWFENTKLTWTPCNAVDTESRCLCAHPVWDGGVEQAQRCSDVPSAPNRPTGIFALRWACKALRRELGAKQYPGAVSLEWLTVYTFIASTPAVILINITRLTLSGDRRRWISSVTGELCGPRFYVAPVRDSSNLYEDVARRFPRLETVAIQGFVWRDGVRAVLAEIRGEVVSRQRIGQTARSRLDCIKQMFEAFSRNVTVILDAWCRLPKPHEHDGIVTVERLIITRPATNSNDTSAPHDWSTCKIDLVPSAKEALQTLLKVQ